MLNTLLQIESRKIYRFKLSFYIGVGCFKSLTQGKFMKPRGKADERNCGLGKWANEQN